MSIYMIQVLLQRVQLVFLPQMACVYEYIEFHHSHQETELGTTVNWQQLPRKRDELAFISYLEERQDFIGGSMQIV
uniref:Uncharacterized protein n=2 Tax=Neospora caninum (strain Liverpool) TaxID=572307 RepID=A0A0F7UC92_NEOCL|nr:TPA: hypothetical protein BN1204_032720 [Neospora caninum Liverpool]